MTHHEGNDRPSGRWVWRAISATKSPGGRRQRFSLRVIQCKISRTRRTMDDVQNNGKRYNGWANYETWVVRLWLDNEEPAYRYWTEQAKNWKGREYDRVRLAEQLKEEVTEAAPELGCTLYSDLMYAAF